LAGARYLQLNSEFVPEAALVMDDPPCTSVGCPKQTYVAAEEAKIVQYPNDPLSDEVKDSFKSENWASESTGHDWTIPAWR
jgi:hypothetical protein